MALSRTVYFIAINWINWSGKLSMTELRLKLRISSILLLSFSGIDKIERLSKGEEGAIMTFLMFLMKHWRALALIIKIWLEEFCQWDKSSWKLLIPATICASLKKYLHFKNSPQAKCPSLSLPCQKTQFIVVLSSDCKSNAVYKFPKSPMKWPKVCANVFRVNGHRRNSINLECSADGFSSSDYWRRRSE